MSSSSPSVDFYFDPICPWAYQASKWARAVREQNGLRINWRFFSLGEINRTPDAPHEWERRWAWGWSLMRVGAMLRREDPDLLDLWCAETGRRFHEEAVPVYRYPQAREAAAELGLARQFDAALEDPTTHDDVRADHSYVVDTYSAFGVPTLVLDGQAIFGPKITPAPTGADALRLWDVVTTWRQIPNLFQLRKPMTKADLAAMDEVFEPYYRSRAWGTTQHSVVEESAAPAAEGGEDGAVCAVPSATGPAQ
jgi:hypothetical protein